MADAPFLLLTKKDYWSQQAVSFAKEQWSGSLIIESGAVGNPSPPSFHLPEYRAIISFLSPWIVPAEMLERSAFSINFHPGSCDYPGIGCYNFALYEEAALFGPVCHHMLPRVDSGTVIAETLFGVTQDDRVETLKLRTMQAMLAMFHHIIPMLAAGSPLPESFRQWRRRPFTRKELNALCEILPEMDEAEKQRRIRATTYPGYPGPYLLKDGVKHYYPVPEGPALA